MFVPPPGALRRHAPVVIAAAAVVAVVGIALMILQLQRLSRDSATASTAADLSAAATTAMTEGGQLGVDFTSFDYRTLAHDRAATARQLTPAFAKAYLAQSRATSSFIRQAKSVSKSQVVSTGLAAYSPTNHTATVLVALNDDATNVKTPAGAVQYYRVEVDLVQQNGRWRASNVVLQ